MRINLIHGNRNVKKKSGTEFTWRRCLRLILVEISNFFLAIEFHDFNNCNNVGKWGEVRENLIKDDKREEKRVCVCVRERDR